MSFEQSLPVSLSPSRLADFQSCPRRYQYASIERIPQPASYASTKGRFIHYILEHLLREEPKQRTIEQARSYVDPAVEEILTTQIRDESGLDGPGIERLLRETEDVLTTYFSMEDPRTVQHEGVELQLGVTIEDTPLYGILDRLDRDENGNLSIVDYKTGGLPNRNFDSKTFANAELYAVLCEAKFGERPTTIRLLYVGQGETIVRPVSDIVTRARSSAAIYAWSRIKRYYDDGEFPATPSKGSCRFCAFKDRCRASGVAVPR